MRLMGKTDSFSLYEYIPTICKPLATDFEKMRCIRRFRFWYELLMGGYKVYYLASDDNLVGYCVVTPGGRRLPVSTKEDIVLGPYYISPEYRGRGYAKQLVGLSLLHCTYDYKCAYDWIHEDNLASIRTSEACGFVREGHRLNVIGLMRKLVLNDNGNNIIYKYTRQ